MHHRAAVTDHRRAPRAAVMVSAFAGVLLAAATALAGNLQLRDTASLLQPADTQQLRSAASRYAFDARVLTSSQFADREAFNRYVGAQVGGANMVVIGIDPVHRRTSVHFGNGTRIAPTHYSAIENAGDAHFRTGNWRAGVQAILDQAQAAVGTGAAVTAPTSQYAPYGGQSSSPYGGATQNAPQPAQRRGFPVGLLLIGLLIGGGVLFALARRRRAAMNRGPFPPQDPYANAGQGPVGPFGGQPGYGPGYGPGGGYGPGYGPRGGGLGAGMLGAGLGGLLGYGLGRATSEHGHHDTHAGEGHAGAGAGPTADPGGGWDAGGSTSGWDDGGGGGDVGGGGDGGGGSDW